MPGRRAAGGLCLGLATALAGCAAPAPEPPGAWFSLPAPRSAQQIALGSWDVPLGADATFLAPNAADQDDTPAYVHVTEVDMPLRVSVGYPPEPPKFGSRKDARSAVIDGIRAWEAAIQPHWPAFRIEFAEQDPDAAVAVRWDRRASGSAAGWAWIRVRVDGGSLRAGGEVSLSIRSEETVDPLRLDAVRLLATHEFGHALGLHHCLECDSAMNYAWETRERVLVTETDVRTFLALVEKPSGHRIDGRPLAVLCERGWTPPACASPGSP
jgi:hypothetical protein